MPFVNAPGQRILFIHIPKTGGTSISEWLRTLGKMRMHGYTPALRTHAQHLTYSDFVDLLGRDYFTYAFAVVRNPYDRLYSEYKMRCALNKKDGLFDNPKFDTWVQTQLSNTEKNRYHLDSHLRPQSDFLGEKLNIFRFEDGVGQIMEAVSRALDLEPPTTIPHRVRSERTESGPILESSTLLRVNEFYRNDFQRLGYKATEPNFRILDLAAAEPPQPTATEPTQQPPEAPEPKTEPAPAEASGSKPPAKTPKASKSAKSSKSTEAARA